MAPEELCHDCPGLLPERRRIVAFEALEPALRNKDTRISSRLPDHADCRAGRSRVPYLFRLRNRPRVGPRRHEGRYKAWQRA